MTIEGLDEFQGEIGAEGLADPRESGHARRRHPSAKEYVRIGVILVVLTTLEVWTSYSGLPHGLMIALLFFFAFVKFALVVLWFMHLRFDDVRYSRFFIMGFVGACILFLVVLLLFKAFAGG
jgi:cytochrome c oxidase subunit IV